MVGYIKYKKFILMVFALVTFPLATEASGDRFVQEVRIEGAVSISAETIRSKLETKSGRITGRDLLNKDIRAIYAMGAFQNVEVDETRGEKGWIVTFYLTEKPVITKVSTSGNKKIKESELKEKAKIPLFQPFNEQKVAEAMEAIREAYAKKKYYLADVDTHLATNKEGDYELVFDIAEHAQTQVRLVHFVGNAVFTDEELRKVAKTKKKGPFSFLTSSGQYKEEELDHDILRLTYHYLKHGYLKVRIEKPQVTLSKDKKYFFVTFTVHEGDRYRVNRVDIGGDILTTKPELVADLMTQKGDIYNRELVEKDIQALTRKYADQGYAFVNIQPATTTNEVDKTADIRFQVEKGNRITIEKIEIKGNTITRDKVIRREMQVKEGDLYNETKVQESRQKIMALGYFKEVNFATPRGSRDDTLNLNITVDEKPTGSFSVGLGFSTAEDFILTGSIQKQNFFGMGWSGEMSAEISSIRQQFLFSMVDPYFLDTEWILGLSASRTVFQYGSDFSGAFNRKSYGGSVSIGHRFFDYASMNLGYEAEQVSAADISAFIPARFRNNASGLTSLMSLTISRDTRDNRIYANKGMFNSVRAEVSDPKLGADNDFYRLTGRTQVYQPLIGKLVFKTYGRLGYIKSLSAQGVPLFERFFLGGPNSLRGYFPNGVGPKEQVTNSSGQLVDFVFGGDKMAVFNMELEHPIVDPAGLRFVTFFDAGNTFPEGSRLDLTHMKLDWGFGIRWISPMGPLRFEWGFPIDKNPDESDTIFNFTIGTFF